MFPSMTDMASWGQLSLHISHLVQLESSMAGRAHMYGSSDLTRKDGIKFR